MASNYLELFCRIWERAAHEWKTNGPTANFLQDFIKDCSQHGIIRKEDLFVTLFLAVVFTLLRYAAAALVFKNGKTKFQKAAHNQQVCRIMKIAPIANYFQFIPKDKKKFPESTWKLLYYFSVYSYCTYILFNGKYTFIEKPSSVWIGWQHGMAIPSDIYYLYVIQSGFYFHSIYGTIYMDKWRSDSVVMILHHILANSLIIFSFAMRYHNIGIIVLFLHDISDIFLESTKILVCFKSAPGKQQRIAGLLVNIGFLLFTFSWFYCRLYQYPYRVLYITGYISISMLPDAPFYLFFNGMLWMLFVMNAWWSHFVLWLIWRVLNGESREVEDTREIDKQKKKQNHANNGEIDYGVDKKKDTNTADKISADEQIHKDEETNRGGKDKTIPHQRRKKNLQGTN